MNKFIKIILATLVPIISLLLGTYLHDFTIIGVISCVTVAFFIEVSLYLHEKNTQLSQEVDNLKNKITEISLKANGGIPYKIQIYTKENTEQIKKNLNSKFEVLVTNLDNSTTLKNIVLSLDLNLNVSVYDKPSESNYTLLHNGRGEKRLSKKEYYFELKNDCSNKKTTKCVFSIKFMKKTDTRMDIKVIDNTGYLETTESIDIKIID